MNVILIGQ